MAIEAELNNSAPDDVERASSKTSRIRWLEFCKLAICFWVGATSRRAWTLTFFVVLFVGLQLAAQLGLNAWNRAFFDFLEKKNVGALTSVVILLPALVAFSGLSIGGALVARMVMQTRWREWLTRRLTGWWLQDQRYYRLEIAAEEQISPEYRIAKDVQLAIEPLVDFATGFLTAITTAFAFIGILWSVGGDIDVSIGSFSLHVPNYLGFSAIAYALVVGFITYFTGRSMVVAVAEKNENEAQFLRELTRIKENAESIALIRGDADESRGLRLTYTEIVRAWLRQIRRHGFIASVQSANGALVPIIPLVLVAPKYLTDALTLGAVVQIASAFVSVQVALNWFVDNFVRGAEWMASAGRVDELVESLEGLDIGATMTDAEFIEFGESADDQIHLENLGVAHRGGQVVISRANVVIRAGEKLLVGGASGTGKSTLVRALAGLWPWGAGRILTPKGVRIAFIPQKPYIPLGTLRQALLYSVTNVDVTEQMVEGAMRRCGLDYLIKHLDQENRWDQILSGGERQRIAFARILIQRPSIIIMDEATSALDEGSQASLLRLFNDDLAFATVISVGHRAGMEDFHDTKLLLERRAAGARMTSRKLEKSLWHMFEQRL